MAVTVTANTRSDYMISDAAMPKVVEEQSDKFAQFLSELDNKSKQFADIKEAYDNGKYDVPTLAELKEQGIVSDGTEPVDNIIRELAKQIVSGKKDIKDVPKELLTPELMAEILLLKQVGYKGDEEDEESEELFDPTEDAVNQSSAVSVNTDIIGELAEIIKAVQGEQTEVVPEELSAVSEVVSLVAPEENTVIEEIVDSHIEAEASPEFNGQQENEFAEKVAESTGDVSENIETKISQSAKTEEKPAVSEENLAVLKEAADKGELEKPVVKTEAETDFSEKDNNTPEQSDVFTERIKPDKQVSEELEMLRNAKSQKTEETDNSDSDSVKLATAVSIDERSIVLERKDGSTVEVKPAEVAEQVLKTLQTAIEENKEQTEYSMVLNPEELGRITVKLTKAADGAVSVTIAAENSRTQRILEEHSELMQSNLKDNGIKLENWQTVSESQQEAHAEDYRGSAKNPYFAQENQSDDKDDDTPNFADIIAGM